MKFFKDNGSMIIRFIITHIGMSVFGLVMFFTTNMQGNTIMLLATLFSAVFYCVIVYTTMWEYGAKDKPAYDAGRRFGAGKCGFFTALSAEAIWIVLALLYLICSYISSDASLICYTVLFLSDSCFTGIEVFIKNGVLKDSSLTPYMIAGTYIIGSLLVSVVSAFGYVLGSKDITIIPKKSTAKK